MNLMTPSILKSKAACQFSGWCPLVLGLVARQFLGWSPLGRYPFVAPFKELASCHALN